MGYREMDLVWKNSQATRLDKFVLLAIAKTYNKGKGSYPSQATLAKMTGIADARGIRRSLQRLTSLGELVWVRGSNNTGKSNVYFITFIEDDVAKLTAVNDQNDRLTSDQIDPLLNKGLDKLLNRQRTLIFSSDPFSECHRVVSSLRPDLSVLQVQEWLTYFANSKHAWWIDNAHTDAILLDKVLACFPSTEGEM
jgi:alkylated DNA nucleotide flippase Atl1